MSSNNLYLQLIDIATQENIEFSEQTQTERNTHVQASAFTLKLKQIRENIQCIHLNNEKILRIKRKLATSALPTEQNQFYDQIGIVCDENYEKILILRKLFEEMTDIVKATASIYPDEPETHSQIYQKQFMAQQVNRIISQTQKIQLLIEKYSINTSLKRIKALAPDLDDEEAESIAKKKNGFDQLVMEKTMGKASLKLKYRIEDIVQKNKQIAKLEQIVEENLRLMEEIAFIVKQQGELIDNIRDNVLNAKDYVEKAESNLKKEKKEHKKSRKKICCIILIAIIVLGLIITPIVLTIVNENKKQISNQQNK